MKEIKLLELIEKKNNGIDGQYRVDYFIDNFNYFEVFNSVLYGVMLDNGEIIGKVEITDEEISESLETYLGYIRLVMKNSSIKIIDEQNKYNEYLEVVSSLREVKI